MSVNVWDEISKHLHGESFGIEHVLRAFRVGGGGTPVEVELESGVDVTQAPAGHLHRPLLQDKLD